MLGAVLDWIDGSWWRLWYVSVRVSPEPTATDWYPSDRLRITVLNLTAIPIDVVVVLWTREGDTVDGVHSAIVSLNPNEEKPVEIDTGRVHVRAIGTVSLSAGGSEYPKAALVTGVEMEGHQLFCSGENRGMMVDVTPRMIRVPRRRSYLDRLRARWRNDW